MPFSCDKPPGMWAVNQPQIGMRRNAREKGGVRSVYGARFNPSDFASAVVPNPNNYPSCFLCG